MIFCYNFTCCCCNRFSPQIKIKNPPDQIFTSLLLVARHRPFPQDILEYKKKQRPQKIKMLDGAVKTIMVDDSKTVGELLVTICSRIGNDTLASPALSLPPLLRLLPLLLHCLCYHCCLCCPCFLCCLCCFLSWKYPS